MTMNTWISNKR